MTDIPLEFARKCLGWKDAKRAKGFSYIRFDSAPYQSKKFHYNDLRKVLKYARFWASHLKIESQDVEPAWYVEAWRNYEDVGKGWKKGNARHNSLCQALMQACVEASEI